MATSIRSRRHALAAWTGLLSLAGATCAHAELGGARASVFADKDHWGAAMSSTDAATYTVFTLAPPGGGTVKEFASLDGMVFAVSWQGPARPDLAQLLGGRFAAFNQGLAARQGPRMSRHVTMARPDLVVRSAGHPGAFHGLAYVPSLLPAGIDANALR